jgi:hypothetical protein
MEATEQPAVQTWNVYARWEVPAQRMQNSARMWFPQFVADREIGYFRWIRCASSRS